MAKYYFALIVTGSLLWLLNVKFSADKEKLSYHNRLLGYGLLLAAVFPVLLSFFELPFTVATLFMVAVGMSWSLPKQIKSQIPAEVNSGIIHADTLETKQAELANKPPSINVEPSIFSSVYAPDYLDNVTYPTSPLSSDIQDSLIVQGFNDFSQGNLVEAAKAFQQVWSNTADSDLLSLLYAQLLQIYQELGQYKKLILLGKRTKLKLAVNGENVQLNEMHKKISQDVEFYRRLFILLAVNGISHMRYSAIPDYLKQQALKG